MRWNSDASTQTKTGGEITNNRHTDKEPAKVAKAQPPQLDQNGVDT